MSLGLEIAAMTVVVGIVIRVGKLMLTMLVPLGLSPRLSGLYVVVVVAGAVPKVVAAINRSARDVFQALLVINYWLSIFQKR